MSEDNNSGCSCSGGYILLGLITAMTGKHIHGSTFWAIMNFFFWWISWAKWLVCQEVNMTIIKDAFSFFFE